MAQISIETDCKGEGVLMDVNRFKNLDDRLEPRR